ncbi:hypothetical protein IKG02_01040 [Candidatus Saccharibacteria bacterium]|nr:hypothetical protein [Candidatus Saccharibacteria bacterium]
MFMIKYFEELDEMWSRGITEDDEKNFGFLVAPEDYVDTTNGVALIDWYQAVLLEKEGMVPQKWRLPKVAEWQKILEYYSEKGPEELRNGKSNFGSLLMMKEMRLNPSSVVTPRNWRLKFSEEKSKGVSFGYRREERSAETGKDGGSKSFKNVEESRNAGRFEGLQKAEKVEKTEKDERLKELFAYWTADTIGAGHAFALEMSGDGDLKFLVENRWSRCRVRLIRDI